MREVYLVPDKGSLLLLERSNLNEYRNLVDGSFHGPDSYAFYYMKHIGYTCGIVNPIIQMLFL